jgi:hypothetical protein
MNKFIKVIAGTMTSLFVVGMFAAPAMAVPGPVEQSVCLAVSAIQTSQGLLAAQSGADLDGLIDDVEVAFADLNTSSTAMGGAGLALIQSLDLVGNEAAAQLAFDDAIEVFTEDLIGFVGLTDEVAAAGVTQEGGPFCWSVLLAGLAVRVVYAAGLRLQRDLRGNQHRGRRAAAGGRDGHR